MRIYLHSNLHIRLTLIGRLSYTYGRPDTSFGQCILFSIVTVDDRHDFPSAADDAKPIQLGSTIWMRVHYLLRFAEFATWSWPLWLHLSFFSYRPARSAMACSWANTNDSGAYNLCWSCLSFEMDITAHRWWKNDMCMWIRPLNKKCAQYRLPSTPRSNFSFVRFIVFRLSIPSLSMKVAKHSTG